MASERRTSNPWNTRRLRVQVDGPSWRSRVQYRTRVERRTQQVVTVVVDAGRFAKRIWFVLEST
jgi:hypothetical protein